jgi:multiple sugar transport system permease protein
MRMKNADRGILSHYDLRKPKYKLMYILMILIIAAMVCSMLYPVTVMLFNAFKPNTEVNSFPPTYFPNEVEWGNFHKAWDFIDIPLFFRNTLYIFLGNITVIFTALGLAAFSLSRLNIPYKKGIYFFFLMTLFIPPTTYIIPNFVNLKDFGLLNSFAALWLPAGANAFFLLLLKTFFDEIHHEIFEAARMDGASEWRCFFQIAVPLSIPIFSTLGIFIFAAVWNDWFWPSMVMHDNQKYPLSTAIYQYVIQARRLDLNVKFAILSMVTIPPIAVFLLFQKFIMRGLHLGGVKG